MTANVKMQMEYKINGLDLSDVRIPEGIEFIKDAMADMF